MGIAARELVRTVLPDRGPHNGRLSVELGQNIHLRYREFSIAFSLNEYLEFADALAHSTEDLRSYLAQNPDYEEGVHPAAVVIVGNERQGRLLQNSPAPHRSAYSPDDFAIELADEAEADDVRVHWRNYRFAVPREHLALIASAFAQAKDKLQASANESEAGNSNHRSRAAGDAFNRFPSDDRGPITAMTATAVPIGEIRTRYDSGERTWNPSESAITELVHRYTDGRLMAPIILSTEPDGSHHVIDGNHRLVAARQAGLAQVDCIVTDLTFDESALFRRAEAILKKFDAATGYRYNTSGFNRQYFAHRASRFYQDHFHRIRQPKAQEIGAKQDQQHQRPRWRNYRTWVRQWIVSLAKRRSGP